MRRLRAWLFAAAVTLLSAWTLVPIYLITIAAFGGPDAVNAWPKSFLPENLSARTFDEFVNIGGIWRPRRRA